MVSFEPLVVEKMWFELWGEFDKLNLRIVANMEVMEMDVDSSLLQDIWKCQVKDEKVQERKHDTKEEKSFGFTEDDQGMLWYKGRIYVPKVKESKDKIFWEALEPAYSIHPWGNRMYHDLKAMWYDMKIDVAENVAICSTCQRVKAKHQQPTGLLKPLQIPEWKWEEISMDFIMGLPKTQSGYDSLWVIVDRLIKVAHFVSIKATYTGPQLVELYVSRIVYLYEVS
jgi:hypothetical protein